MPSLGGFTSTSLMFFASVTWLWSQLETWLRRHLAQRSPDEIRREIETLRRNESNLIERLVTESTWGSLNFSSTVTVVLIAPIMARTVAKFMSAMLLLV
jgi:Sec-independent protein secretion pathway component TatC